MAQHEEERRKKRALAARQRRAAKKQQQTSEEIDVTSPQAQLAELTARTVDQPTDSDRDIDFAYRNMSNVSLLPSQCPSTGAWQWYLYSLMYRDKFLEITQKREDAKAKQAGTITSQRMEDDKRKQFAIIDRIERQLQLNVDEAVDDLMSKFPDDVLDRCRRHKEAWDSYFQRKPL